MSNIFIDIAATFTGEKAFKKASNSTDKLGKSVKSLAKTLGVGLSAAAVLSYAKASVKAYAADDNAARSLGVTLKNLGLETGNTSIYVNDLIARLEKQTGVLDDELRPAMDRLLRATGSVTKSQDLLNLALDISAGTGKDLTSVSQALQKAYLGNNVSLSKLGVGLSKVELTSSSFEKIQKRLAILFAGQASTAAESYAGQLNKLNVASNNVKEAIGRGIVDALVILADNNTVDNLATDMENLGVYTGDVIRGFGIMAAKIKEIPGISGFDVGMIPVLGTYIKVLQEEGAKARRIADALKGKNPIQSGTYLNKPKPTKTELDALANAKKLAAQQAAQLKLQQAATKISAAAAKFDLNKIQIAAALKGKISDEDRQRLLLMQAIENENVDLIDKYTKSLAEAQAQTKQLQSVIDASKASFVWPDPFASFKLQAEAAGTTVQALVDKVKTLSGISFDNSTVMTSFAQGMLNGMSAVDALWGARPQSASTADIPFNMP